MRNPQHVKRTALSFAVALTLLFTGCTQSLSNGFLPGVEDGVSPVTNHTERITALWVNSWIVLLFVGLIVWVLVIWSVIVYRKRKNVTDGSEIPPQTRYNMPVEVFFTVVPLILVLGFFVFTARDQAAIEEPMTQPDVRIQVYAKQWAWDFNYLDDDVYYPGIQVQPDPTNQVRGSVKEDLIPTLYLPENKKIELILDSRDVIHSFWVPAMLYKKDLIPGKTNYMYFETTNRTGTFVGKCAELCGEYHSMMLFNVSIVSQEEYDEHILSLREKGYVGKLGSEYDRNQNLPGTGSNPHE